MDIDTPTKRLAKLTAQDKTKGTTPSSSKHQKKYLYSTDEEPLDVYIRIRPINEEEKKRGETSCIDVSSDKELIISAPEKTSYYRTTGGLKTKYSFTNIFTEDTSQRDVYESIAQPMFNSFFSGERSNCLILSFGNSSSGKTYSITGPDSNPGVITRLLTNLFQSISSSSYPSKFKVFVSYYEVYNEDVFDLLRSPSIQKYANQSLQVKENTDESRFYVDGLTERLICSTEQGLDQLRDGNRNRTFAETALNHDSSRSHSIFTIKLVETVTLKTFESPAGAALSSAQKHKKTLNSSEERVRKFAIVDLAGNERSKRTGAAGVRLKEAGSINKSLMTFKSCISALRENQISSALPTPGPKQTVPFRDSKLTKLLQDYFISGSAIKGEKGGKAAMLVCCGPAGLDYEETAAVLKFSALASQITTSLVAAKPASKKRKAEKEKDKSKEKIKKIKKSDETEEKNKIQEQQQQQEEDEEDEEYMKQEVKILRKRVMDMMVELARKEAEIRAECVYDLGKRMMEMEILFKERMYQEYNVTEEKYARKVSILNRMLRPSLESDSLLETSSEEAMEDIRRVQEKYVKLKDEVGQLKREKMGMEKEMEELELEMNEEREKRKEVERRVEDWEAGRRKELERWKGKVEKEYEERLVQVEAESGMEKANLVWQMKEMEKENAELRKKLWSVSQAQTKGSPIPRIIVTPPRDDHVAMNNPTSGGKKGTFFNKF